MSQSSNTTDVRQLEEEFALGAACVKARAATIKRQMLSGGLAADAAASVWGAMKAAERQPTIGAMQWFCDRFNDWAGRYGEPQTVGQVITNAAITDDAPLTLLDAPARPDETMHFVGMWRESRPVDIRGDEQ